jgi:hypothetical protein
MRSRTHMASLRLHMCHLEAPSRPCTQRSYARKSLSMPLPTPVACHTPASSFGRAKVRSWTPASVQNDVRRAPHPSVCPITPLPSVRFVCGSLESCQLSCCGRALCVPCCARPFLLPPHLPPSHVLPFPIPRAPPPPTHAPHNVPAQQLQHSPWAPACTPSAHAGKPPGRSLFARDKEADVSKGEGRCNSRCPVLALRAPRQALAAQSRT